MHQHHVVAAGVVEAGRHRDLHPEVARELHERRRPARRPRAPRSAPAEPSRRAVVDVDDLVRRCPSSAARSRRCSSPQAVGLVEHRDHDRDGGAAVGRGGQGASSYARARAGDRHPRQAPRRAVRSRACAPGPGWPPRSAYALLALALVAPGALPGHTLSASDYLWSAAPWQAERPAGVQRARLQLRAGGLRRAVPAVTQYLRERLPDAPLWNPYQGGGRPFVANAQSALFSPFTWPSLILPFWFSLAVAAALKLFAAALGTFWLGRALGMGGAGAFLAGLAFAFGLWFVTWLSWPLDAVWAWLPWLLLLAGRVVRAAGARGRSRRSRSSWRCSSSAATRSRASTCWPSRRCSPCCRSRAPGAPRAARRSGGWRSGWGGHRAGRDRPAAVRRPAAPLGRPRLAGGARSRSRWRSSTCSGSRCRSTGAARRGVISEPFINARAWYVGALPLLLAGVALLRGSARADRGRRRAALVALLVATGVQPLFWIAHQLPGFNQSHNTRLGVVVALGARAARRLGAGRPAARPSPRRPPPAAARRRARDRGGRAGRRRRAARARRRARRGAARWRGAFADARPARRCCRAPRC